MTLVEMKQSTINPGGATDPKRDQSNAEVAEGQKGWLDQRSGRPAPEQFRAARIEAGLSVYWVAWLAGISSDTLNRLEKGGTVRQRTREAVLWRSMASPRQD